MAAFGYVALTSFDEVIEGLELVSGLRTIYSYFLARNARRNLCCGLHHVQETGIQTGRRVSVLTALDKAVVGLVGIPLATTSGKLVTPDFVTRMTVLIIEAVSLINLASPGKILLDGLHVIA